MSGQGSTGNVIAALCSFFIPGWGQLIQGRLLATWLTLALACSNQTAQAKEPAPGRPVKVAAIAIGLGGEWEPKLKLAAEHLEAAGSRGVDIVCLPEEFAGLTPESLAGQTAQAMGALAKKHGMYVVCPIREEAEVMFATVDEGREILTARDDFIERQSPFDRAARMKTDRPVGEEEFLTFVGRNVLEWGPADRQKLQTVFDRLAPRLAPYAALLPQVDLIKTSGDEEGGAAYTRAGAIVLSESRLAGDVDELERLMVHELFHLLSRKNPKLRDKLYEVIGFEKCDELAFPAELAPRKITNPDAPRNDHFIRVTVEGREALAIPILFADSDQYDVKRGGEFFSYLQFELLLVERDGDSSRVTPLAGADGPRLVNVRDADGFFDQVGMNTRYIIHPEEILADNFAMLVLEDDDAATPQILAKLREVLANPPAEEDEAPFGAQ